MAMAAGSWPLWPPIKTLQRIQPYAAAMPGLRYRRRPARRVKASLAGALHGGNFLNRQAWKFQGWLQGYNGGPLRMPTQRIHDHQMAALRKGCSTPGSRRAWTRSGSSSPGATWLNGPGSCGIDCGATSY
jgi:hypothetical protein